MGWARPQQTEPDALSDQAFEQALPPLEATAIVPAEPAPAPTDEPELQAPLTDLAGFNPEPPPATAETVAAEEPTPLRYKVEVKGLDDVGLEGRFKELSALQHDGKRAANAAQIRARADEDVALAGRLLRSEGFLDGSATVTIPPIAAPGETVPVTILATPGERYRIGSVTLTGLAPEPLGIATKALDLQPGDPIAAQPIQDAEARIALRLPEQGYPFVTVGQRDILLDPATFKGDYTLPVESGAKARFGGLQTSGDGVFGLDHLALFPRFRQGELYDSRKLDDLRQALIATSLFSTVAIEPVKTGTINPDGTEAVDLMVRQTRGPARTLAGSAGYATGEGIKLAGSWQHNNLFKPEGALIVDAVAGTRQQSLAGTFRRSNAGKRDRTFQAGAAVLRQRFDAYNAQTLTLNASMSRLSTPIWQKRWTYSLGAELTASRETPFDPGDTSRNYSTYLIAALPSQLGYDRSDSLLDPTRGFRVSGKLSPEAQKRTGGGGFDAYGRMLLEGSAYLPFAGKSFVLAGRARVGSIMGAGRDDIAPSRRLYSGGGGSVRGFGYQQLGPKDANGDPIGGRSLTEFAGEVRYRFGTYGLVGFVDGGRVGEESRPGISNMRYGAGIGARYYTNFGPFRLDVATPIGRKKGESKVAVYMSIGQAF